MATYPVFHGTVSDAAKLVLAENEAALRHAYLKSLIGQKVDVIVRKERVQRSLNQNAYLHAHPFPLLADHFGDSIEGTKLDLMGEFWGWKRSPVTGKDVPVKPHTSDMSVDECTLFIDWLIPWAAKQGVLVPYPGEASA